MNYQYRTWYVTMIAACYLALCSANVLYLGVAAFHPGFIHSLHELFPLGGAMLGWLYFFKPHLSHKGLLALTILAILAIGESDPKATLFHVTVLALLLLPFVTRRPRNIPKPPRLLLTR
ncbi:MAG: hypothetical protein WCI73_08410 [Phycisphaerae bacterium]